jgi:hypothetical protein
MLEIDYSEHFQQLKQAARWDVRMPESMSRFFEETGALASLSLDKRRAVRLRVRTNGVLVHEVALPAVERDLQPRGFFLADVSRHGASFISGGELLPMEEVRLYLPTFWLQVRVVRALRLGPACYQVGAELLRKHAPSPKAFKVQLRRLDAVVA